MRIERGSPDQQENRSSREEVSANGDFGGCMGHCMRARRTDSNDDVF